MSHRKINIDELDDDRFLEDDELNVLEGTARSTGTTTITNIKVQNKSPAELNSLMEQKQREVKELIIRFITLRIWFIRRSGNAGDALVKAVQDHACGKDPMDAQVCALPAPSPPFSYRWVAKESTIGHGLSAVHKECWRAWYCEVVWWFVIERADEIHLPRHVLSRALQLQHPPSLASKGFQWRRWLILSGIVSTVSLRMAGEIVRVSVKRVKGKINKKLTIASLRFLSKVALAVFFAFCPIAKSFIKPLDFSYWFNHS